MALAFKGPGPNYLLDDQGDGSDKTNVKNIAISNNSSSPSSGNSNGLVLQAEAYNHPEEPRSSINFKSGFDNFMHSSLLSFEQSERSSIWEGNLNHNTHQWNQLNPKYSSSDPRLVEDFNCFDTASNYGDWLYTDATSVTDCILESGSSQDATSLKRLHTVFPEYSKLDAHNFS